MAIGFGVEKETVENRIRLAANEYKNYPGDAMDKVTLHSILSRYGLDSEINSFHKYLIEQQIVEQPKSKNTILNAIKRVFGYK